MRLTDARNADIVYDSFVGDPEHGIKPDAGAGILPEKRLCPVCGEIMIKR